MRLLWRRPLFCACLFALLPVVLLSGKLAPVRPFVIAAFLIAAIVLPFFFKKRFKRFFPPFLSLAMAALLLLSSYLYFDVSYSSYQELVGEIHEISGYVTEQRTEGESYRIRVRELDGEARTFTAILRCDFSSGLQIGDGFSATVTGAKFSDEDGDDESDFLADGVRVAFLCESFDDLVQTGKEKNHPLLVLRQWNLRLSSRLRDAVSGEEGNLASALLLGNRSGLLASTTLAFRRTGISHLLALSGLHVSILIGGITLLFRRLKLKRLYRVPILVLLLLFYLGLTGVHMSTLRAVLMVFVLYLSYIFSEENDPVTSLGVILYLTLLVAPYSILDHGMWMSYLATLGILAFAPLRAMLENRLKEKNVSERRAKFLSWIVALFSVGIAANAALLLYMACVFGEVAVFSVPLTILLSIPTTLTLIGSIFTLAFPVLGVIPRMGARVMILLARAVSDRPHVLLPFRASWLIVLVVLFTILLVVLAVANIKRLVPFLLVPIAFLLLFGAAFANLNTINASIECDEYSLFIKNGKTEIVAEKSDTSDAAYLIRIGVQASGGVEIDDLVFTDYATKQPYFLAKLASKTRVFYLHLPQPKDRTELAMARRLEDEASYHRIYVIYDAQTFLE